PLTLDDPQANRLRAAATEDPLSIFNIPDIVPPALQPFRAEVAEALARLAKHGARQTLQIIGGK
ncbi:MAG TPA: hypothetical protein VL614_15540, partial [Acetobacteraceae bacterium]|nr:hypothetical protein [Acetobacteraceae bacterium]